MNINNHLLLDEFLEGRLSANERKKFLTKLETDADLRSLVEAERVIKQSVITNKQELDEVDHSATYSFLLAGLAASTVVAASTSATATAATKTTTAKSIGSSILGSGSKSAILSLTVSVVASAAIGVATYQLRHSNEASQIEQTAPQHSAQPALTPAVTETPSERVIPSETHFKKGIAQKPGKQSVKNGNNEVFHDIYGDVIESKNNSIKNPAPK